MRPLLSGLLALAIGLPLTAVGSEGPYDGVTLFQPIGSTTTYLLDLHGSVVHTWDAQFRPGMSVYLTDDLQLIRTQRIGTGPAGTGGRIERVAWDGTVSWQWDYNLPDVRLQHHDIQPMPNGNILLIAWDYKTDQEAIQQGRDPALLGNGVFLPDSIIEVQPSGSDVGTIVWEWHAWDHLIQDFDPALPNYGVVADHPELIDLNFPPSISPNDWNHFNSVDYNEGLDQILISVHHFSELWIIDHSTTTAEAAGHTGGASGMGGDLMYRWGNPEAYRAGGPMDQMSFRQHDATWIRPGFPGEGNILFFNNGNGRLFEEYSSVDEFTPPVDANGHYTHTPGTAYEPNDLSWIYTAPNSNDFYSANISGAERLRNGNTLVCSGAQGWFFEVTESGQMVWEHLNDIPSTANNRVFKIRRYDLCETPITYCQTAPNSLGAGARIGWSGSNSVTANDLVLEVSSAAAGQVGIFMLGVERNQLPFGEGWRCLGGTGTRLPPVLSDSSGGATYAFDLTAPQLPPGGINEFELYNFQYWYRDPLFGGSQFNLSDALQVRFCP